jgi:transcription antitermination factor NusG
MLNEDSIPRWYAAYTRANHEKSASKQLDKRSVESFVPTFESVRKWKDRSKRLELPLFPGYVFVRVAIENRLNVLVVPGIVRLVGFDKRPVALANEEIETLRMIVKRRIPAAPHPFLTTGCKVRITRGPLVGMQGVLLRTKGRVRLLLSIDLIRQSATVEVDSADVEPVSIPRSFAISQPA